MFGLIAVILPRLLILVIFTPSNALLSNFSRLGSDRSFISRDVQPSKALPSITVNDIGNAIFKSEVHPWKAFQPILVSADGKYILLSAEQP